MFDSVSRVCAVSAAGVVVFMMFAIIADATGRWVNRPIYGVYELNQLLIAVMIYLGVTFTQERKRHITVPILTMRLPKRTASILDIPILVISAFFFGWNSYIFYQKAWTAFVCGETYQGIIRFPMFPASLVMFVGISFLTIQLVIDITRRVLDIITLSRGEKVSIGKG